MLLLKLHNIEIMMSIWMVVMQFLTEHNQI